MQFFLYLKLEPYLREWLINRHSGTYPVILRRGSIEAKRLRLVLTARPQNAPAPKLPDAQDTQIVIPAFKGIDIRYMNYVPQAGINLLVNTIRAQFDSELFDWMARTHIAYERIDNLIIAFLENNNIEVSDTNFFTVIKRYRSLRNRIYAARSRHKKNNSPS